MRTAKSIDFNKPFPLLAPGKEMARSMNNQTITINTNNVVREPWYERWGIRSGGGKQYYLAYSFNWREKLDWRKRENVFRVRDPFTSCWFRFYSVSTPWSYASKMLSFCPNWRHGYLLLVIPCFRPRRLVAYVSTMRRYSTISNQYRECIFSSLPEIWIW